MTYNTLSPEAAEKLEQQYICPFCGEAKISGDADFYEEIDGHRYALSSFDCTNPECKARFARVDANVDGYGKADVTDPLVGTILILDN